jgi:hypothetical protein
MYGEEVVNPRILRNPHVESDIRDEKGPKQFKQFANAYSATATLTLKVTIGREA